MLKMKDFNDTYFRIEAAHITVVLLLIINIVFFTSNEIAVYVQLFIAFAITLHHIDSIFIKKELDKTQKKLLQNNELFDKYLLVSETDLNGVITYVNDHYCNTTGYTKDELIGSTHSIIRDMETDKKTYELLWDTIKNNKIFSTKLKNKKKDGDPFWVDIHIVPTKIYNGDIEDGYRAIMYDITDDVINESSLINALINKSSLFEFAINSSRDGFWDYDLVSKTFFLSRRWKKRLGFSENEEIGYLDYISLIPSKNRFEHHLAMQDIMESSDEDSQSIHFRVRYPIVTKNGEKLVIDDTGDIFFDDDKNPIRITGFHMDVTEHERQAKMIESQNRISAMGEMMSNIAHQWRQPISAINNALTSLELEIELNELKQIESETFLDTSSRIKKYITYLNNTIDDFRKLTSNEKEKTKFNLKNTLNEAFKIAESEYKRHHINFSINSDTDENIEIRGYERELKQVLINILNNAKDVCVERKIKNPSINTSIIDSINSVTIVIQDNAGGISEDIISKIFDPYFTTKHQSMGTGLGLNMSKKIIVEYFRGTLEVENKNNGAQFTIVLPK